MILPTCPVFTPVEVVWADAAIDGLAQFRSPSEAILEAKVTIRKSLGYWVGNQLKDGVRSVLIAVDDDRENDGGPGGIITIPLGMVQRIETLRWTGRKPWVAPHLRKLKNKNVGEQKNNAEKENNSPDTGVGVPRVGRAGSRPVTNKNRVGKPKKKNQ
jgi:hypothetical protein